MGFINGIHWWWLNSIHLSLFQSPTITWIHTNTNLATFPRNFAYSAQITLFIQSIRSSAELGALMMTLSLHLRFRQPHVTTLVHAALGACRVNISSCNAIKKIKTWSYIKSTNMLYFSIYNAHPLFLWYSLKMETFLSDLICRSNLEDENRSRL